MCFQPEQVATQLFQNLILYLQKPHKPNTIAYTSTSLYQISSIVICPPPSVLAVWGQAAVPFFCQHHAFLSAASSQQSI